MLGALVGGVRSRGRRRGSRSRGCAASISGPPSSEPPSCMNGRKLAGTPATARKTFSGGRFVEHLADLLREVLVGGEGQRWRHAAAIYCALEAAALALGAAALPSLPSGATGSTPRRLAIATATSTRTHTTATAVASSHSKGEKTDITSAVDVETEVNARQQRHEDLDSFADALHRTNLCAEAGSLPPQCTAPLRSVVSTEAQREDALERRAVIRPLVALARAPGGVELARPGRGPATVFIATASRRSKPGSAPSVAGDLGREPRHVRGRCASRPGPGARAAPRPRRRRPRASARP